MNWFYGDEEGFQSSTKVLILGSADDDGMNYCDFSRYNTRQLSIRKAEITDAQIKKMIKDASKFYDENELFTFKKLL